MADRMSQKMSSGTTGVLTETPKMGDQFKCEKCGMQIKVTADCRCDDPEHVHFECCGEPLAKT